jgi:hypothetical protein
LPGKINPQGQPGRLKEKKKRFNAVSTDESGNYSILHEAMPGYGRTGLRLKPFILPLILDLKANQILDFGCGKGALGTSLMEGGLNVTLFDPFVEAYNQKPCGEYDIVLNTDVLEHIPEDVLPSVLEEIAGYSKNAVFVISLTFADHILANGDNAHCTIRSRDWWRKKLEEVFPSVEEVATLQKTACCFVTWNTQAETRRRLERLRTFARSKEGLKRRVLSPFRKIADHMRSWVSVGQALGMLEGKSVALVGNSPLLSFSESGEDIDAHDVVIRINRSPIMSSLSHGTKTDWIATSTHVSSGLVDGRGVSLSLWMTEKSDRIPLWMFRGKRKVFRFPKASSECLKRELNGRPSSGFMVFDLLRKSKAREVKFYGFDGFASGSLSGDQTKESAPHNFKQEAKIMREFSSKMDNFIIIDLPKDAQA